nr:hypothetical protein [uncultured Flavobacterium sp.]
MKNIFLTLLIFSLSSIAQAQNEYYVDDVENIEYVNVLYCVHTDGTSTVAANPETTTYKNQTIIDQIIAATRKNIVSEAKPPSKGNCYEYRYNILNRKLEKSQLNKKELALINNFKTGNYKYAEIYFEGVTISRTNDFQIEKRNDEVYKYSIKWPKPDTYILNLVETNNKEAEHLLNVNITVEIIKVISPTKYLYRSYVDETTKIFGIIEKI